MVECLFVWLCLVYFGCGFHLDCCCGFVVSFVIVWFALVCGLSCGAYFASILVCLCIWLNLLLVWCFDAVLSVVSSVVCWLVGI